MILNTTMLLLMIVMYLAAPPSIKSFGVEFVDTMAINARV